MSVRNLLDPIIDQGIRHTNFFEGRLLTAQDLRDQQQANREWMRRLGRAIGAGVIDGLEVQLENDGADGSVPVVTVTSGLALNGDGDIIGLPKQDVQVALSRTIEATPTTDADFYACAGPPTSKHLPNGVGVYILVMAPAAGYQELAPKSGLGDEGVVRGCGSRYVREGVRFRLVEFSPTTLPGVSQRTKALLAGDLLSQGGPATRADGARLSMLRNILAHLCLGTEEWPRFPADPLDSAGTSTAVGALGTLRAGGHLMGCDVPLALLYWTLDGVAFCDLWAVRRATTIAAQPDESIGGPGRHSAAVSHARGRQFQTHLRELINSVTSPSSIAATAYFRYLPPVGLLPLADTANARGLAVPAFLRGRTYRGPVVIEGARLSAAFPLASGFPAVDLAEGEVLWVYLLRENRQALALDPSSTSAAALFATGHLPYIGDARFDVNRWDHSNFGSLRVR